MRFGKLGIVKPKETEDEYMQLNDYTDMLPLHIKRFLSDCNINFIVDADEIEKEFKKRNLDDVDSYLVVQIGLRTLKILKADIYVKSAENVLHEIGHMLDFHDGDIKHWSSSMAFQQIWKDEKDISGYSEYLKETPREYFAESFLTYILDPTGLETDRPRTYRFVHNIAEHCGE